MKKVLSAAVVVVICSVGAHSFAADAQNPQPSAKAPGTDHEDTSKEDAGKHAHNASKVDRDHGLAEDSGADGAKGCPICPVRSADELNVLMTLRERHADVMARESAVLKREDHVAELERTLDERVAKLDGKMDKLEERLNMAEPGRAAQEKRITALVETLSGLTAKKAAPILAEAEPEVAAELLRRMDAAKAAALLAVMPAAKAGQFISLGIGSNAAKKTAQAASAQENKEATP